MVSFSQVPAVKKTPFLEQLKQNLALLGFLELYLNPISTRAQYVEAYLKKKSCSGSKTTAG